MRLCLVSLGPGVFQESRALKERPGPQDCQEPKETGWDWATLYINHPSWNWHKSLFTIYPVINIQIQFNSIKLSQELYRPRFTDTDTRQLSAWIRDIGKTGYDTVIWLCLITSCWMDGSVVIIWHSEVESCFSQGVAGFRGERGEKGEPGEKGRDGFAVSPLLTHICSESSFKLGHFQESGWTQSPLRLRPLLNQKTKDIILKLVFSSLLLQIFNNFKITINYA